MLGLNCFCPGIDYGMISCKNNILSLYFKVYVGRDRCKIPLIPLIVVCEQPWFFCLFLDRGIAALP